MTARCEILKLKICGSTGLAEVRGGLQPPAPDPQSQGFTLVELLVVVTIIVVLLSLLVPAISQAIYMTEVAVCATNLKGVASSVTMYAGENKRAYPKGGKRESQPANLIGGGPDWRPQLQRAFDVNSFLNCPLNSYVDFMTQVTGNQGIWADYNLYFGWAYQGLKGMNRVGDRWECDTWEAGRVSFNVVAADRDLVMPGRANGGELQSSHPDRNATTTLYTIQDGPGLWGQVICTISLWQKTGVYQRGDIDQNFAYDDGSVLSLRDVRWFDDRLLKVRTWWNNTKFESVAAGESFAPAEYSQVPRN